MSNPDYDYIAVILIETLNSIAFLALISLGLAVIFGMMKVINLMHGELLTIGGYATIVSVNLGINLYVGIFVVAPLVTGILGLIVERCVIRFLYGRMIDTMLATWGLSLFFIGLITTIFGNTTTSVPNPIKGIQIGVYQIGGYNLLITLVTVILFVAVFCLFKFTDIGLKARAMMQNPEVTSTFGHNPSLVYMLTFAFGSAITGLAGGLLAPLVGLVPTSGMQYVTNSFITVITGGPAVFSGVIAASGFLGVVNKFFNVLTTSTGGEIALLVAGILLLRLMPKGFTGGR